MYTVWLLINPPRDLFFLLPHSILYFTEKVKYSHRHLRFFRITDFFIAPPRRSAPGPGFPLQVLGFANANPAGFPLQSLARAPAAEKLSLVFYGAKNEGKAATAKRAQRKALRSSPLHGVVSRLRRVKSKAPALRLPGLVPGTFFHFTK
jgi:hypothetical protein